MKKINIKQVAVEVAATGAGAVAALKAGPMLEKIGFLAGKPLFKGGALVAAGVIIKQMFGKGKSASIANSFAGGVIAVGSAQVANGTVFKSNPVSISGVGGFPVLGEVDSASIITEDYMNVNGMPVMGGAADFPQDNLSM